jgi:hypothetical protein
MPLRRIQSCNTTSSSVRKKSLTSAWERSTFSIKKTPERPVSVVSNSHGAAVVAAAVADAVVAAAAAAEAAAVAVAVGARLRAVAASAKIAPSIALTDMIVMAGFNHVEPGQFYVLFAVLILPAGL